MCNHEEFHTFHYSYESVLKTSGILGPNLSNQFAILRCPKGVRLSNVQSILGLQQYFPTFSDMKGDREGLNNLPHHWNLL